MKPKQEQDNLVVKHNDLNSISYFDSSVQLKIFSRLIVEIRKNPNQKLYSLLIKDVLEEINPNNNLNKNYSYLKDVAKEMFKVIDIPAEKGFDLRALFISINTKDKSFIHFEVNPSLKPYILKLSKNFTYYFLENIATLNSNFSIRIYELLKQYQDAKTGGGWVNITIHDLKQFLGIKESQYKQYYNFKTRVILTAQRELGIKTDIKFTFVEEKKIGKKVDKIIFQILPNKKVFDSQLGFDFSDADETNKIKFIREELEKDLYGLSQPIINKILQKIKTSDDQKNILGALRAAKNYINLKQGKCKPTAVTQSAIKDGWYEEEVKPLELKQSIPEPEKPIEIDNNNPFWQQLILILKTNFTEEVFDKWLSKLNFSQFVNEKLILAVESKFLRDWIGREYQESMLTNFESSGVKKITIISLN